MKKISYIIFGIFIVLANINAQTNPSAKKWQDDLDYMIKRIEITHPDPFTQITREEFHSLKDKLYSQIPALNTPEIVIKFSELLATLKDGHTKVWFERCDPNWMNTNFHCLPLMFYRFVDGVFIIAGDKKYHGVVGSRVIKIGRMKIDDVLSKIGLLCSFDNKSTQSDMVSKILGCSEMLKIIGAIDNLEKVKLTVIDSDNAEKAIEIESMPIINALMLLSGIYQSNNDKLTVLNGKSSNPLPLWLKNITKYYWFEYIPDENMVYAQINTLKPVREGEGETFNQFCEKLFATIDAKKPQKLVIDVRTNNGGNHQELPLLKGIIARPHLDNEYSLFLIIGRTTFSAAQHFTTVFDRYTNATLIGEPTGGKPNHFGANRSFKLPNHPEVVINCSIDYYQDSEPFDFNISTYPDFSAPMSSENYRNNIDPALEKIKHHADLLRKVMRIADELKNAYSTGGFPELKKIFQAKKNELLETGYNIEKFFLDFNDNWFYANKKSMEDYIEFLKLACEECPESIDLHYSLGLAYQNIGKNESAKECYTKCLKINPACHYAGVKLKLLSL